MPSSTSALPFAAKAPPPAPASASASASAGTVPASDDPGTVKKPAFDEMVRRPVKRDDTARATTARAGEAKDPSAPPTGATARKTDDARASTDEDTAAAQDAASRVVLTLLEAPVPAPVMVPANAAAPTMIDLASHPSGTLLPDTASPTTPLEPDALLAGARAPMPAPLPGGMPALMAAGIDAASADPAPTNSADASTATALPAATAAPETSAKAPLQNLLSFATHLAAGQVAAAVPDAVQLGRDIVDALRSDDGDAPAPVNNLLAGVGASNAPLGLSRTETVNPMEAPSADLHGGHFDDDIGDAVRWMADQKIGHAHIKVTPNDLGTVEIRLRLDGDRVHADFSSAQADVRQALESSLPRLRDMLGQHGFQLAHADVGQQHAPPSQGGAPQHGEASGDAGEPVADPPRTVRMTARGLVDAYA